MINGSFDEVLGEFLSYLLKLLTIYFFLYWKDVINVLLKNSSNHQGKGCENSVVQCYIHIVKYTLSWESTVKAKYKSRYSKDYVFVKKVQNHLRNSHVIPPSMYKNEPSQHSKLWHPIITCLNCSHSFLSKKTDTDICCFYHGDIIFSISNG